MSPDQTGVSYGSGVLVAVHGTCALVLTNWHVIREAAGPVQVVFPDGFRSAATVMATDRDWDLAALAIWRPRAGPVALAAQPPRPGDALTIAGYGRGWYRESSGRCTQYLSPGMDLPFDLVELATPARQGDSGGPIFNQRGELAGVLFGSAFGRTTGSHCGRVRWFLDRVWPDFRELAEQPTVIAQSPHTPQSPVASIQAVRSQGEASPIASGSPSNHGWAPSAPVRGGPGNERTAAGRAHDGLAEVQTAPTSPHGDLAGVPAGAAPGADDPGPSPASWRAEQSGPLMARLEQVKTLLALVGGGCLLLGGLRLLGRAVG